MIADTILRCWTYFQIDFVHQCPIFDTKLISINNHLISKSLQFFSTCFFQYEYMEDEITIHHYILSEIFFDKHLTCLFIDWSSDLSISVSTLASFNGWAITFTTMSDPIEQTSLYIYDDRINMNVQFVLLIIPLGEINLL